MCIWTRSCISLRVCPECLTCNGYFCGSWLCLYRRRQTVDATAGIFRTFESAEANKGLKCTLWGCTICHLSFNVMVMNSLLKSKMHRDLWRLWQGLFPGMLFIDACAWFSLTLRSAGDELYLCGLAFSCYTRHARGILDTLQVFGRPSFALAYLE